MKLRYLREQKERAKASLLGNNQKVKASRKKNKFNLNSDDESDDQDVMVGFTHRGRKLGEFEDDFKEKIEVSSDDEPHVKQRDQGKLTEEMVNRMNFGGGELDEDGNYLQPQKKKTRKEIFDEIIEKSKAWDAAKREIKDLNNELREELDDEYQDLIGLLDFNRKKASEEPLKKASDPFSYEEIAHSLKASAKIAPAKL